MYLTKLVERIKLIKQTKPKLKKLTKLTELTNTSNEDSFDPTPKLKSSPVPILFVPFNQDDENCTFCRHKYSKTLFVGQKYCENCLFRYVNDITGNDIYLDVHISTKDIHCEEHETSRNKNFCTLNIREWCKNCSVISWFKQVVLQPTCSLYFYAIDIGNRLKTIEVEEDCKLCGKFIQRFFEFYEFKICSNCYLIFSGWTESLHKEAIPTIHLPWWDTTNKCIICKDLSLDIFTSSCQKWCSNCYILYTVCRYCLTTNITFGLTNKSQCRKCKRIVHISTNDMNIMSCGNYDIDKFLCDIRSNTETSHKIAGYMNNNHNHKDSNLSNFYDFIYGTCLINLESSVKWIPYSQITVVKEIAKGGYGIIYEAIWSTNSSCFNGRKYKVALKKFTYSQDFKKYFLNEVKTHYYIAFYKMFLS